MLGDLLWSDFLDSLEPILAQKRNLSRAACPAKLDAPPPAVPFAFFEISPAEFLFLSEKGLAGGSPAIHGRGGAALVGIADALRAPNNRYNLHKSTIYGGIFKESML